MVKTLIFTLIASIFTLGAINATNIEENAEDIVEIRSDVEKLQGFAYALSDMVTTVEARNGQDEDFDMSPCFQADCYYDWDTEMILIGRAPDYFLEKKVLYRAQRELFWLVYDVLVEDKSELDPYYYTIDVTPKGDGKAHYKSLNVEDVYQTAQWVSGLSTPEEMKRLYASKGFVFPTTYIYPSN